MFISITIEDRDTLTFYRHVTETGQDSAVISITKLIGNASVEPSCTELEIPLDRIKEFVEGLRDVKRSDRTVKRLMGEV